MSAAKDPRVAIYARVSTGTQSVHPQESVLREFANKREWTQVRVYSDRAVSGALDRRPALDELMRDCRRRAVDIVLVWRFDRFGRSVRHLIEALEEFRQLKIDFISLTESVDTSTAAGRLFFSMIAVFANFERDLISERVKLGLVNARQKGKRLGRPPIKILDPAEARKLRKERVKGKATLRELAHKFGVSLWCAHSICKTQGQGV
jgi:DNA invertase Pin-like site-specific DNA recombinase